MYPEEIKYTKDHEWVRVNKDVAEIGITVFAEQLLGDVVFVDLPDVGEDLVQFSKFGEIESVKAVSDLFAPISGEIIEKNSPKEFFNNPQHDRTKLFLSQIL